MESRPKELLERVREAIQRRHHSGRTEESYVHKDVKTTMIYTHLLNRGRLAVRNPLDSR